MCEDEDWIYVYQNRLHRPFLEKKVMRIRVTRNNGEFADGEI
jgi:hypothetical protein